VLEYDDTIQHRNRRHTQKNTAKKKKKERKKVSFLSSYRFLFLTTVLEYSSTVPLSLIFSTRGRNGGILSYLLSGHTRHNKKQARSGVPDSVGWAALRAQ